jgi:hypothetical protein
MLSYVSYFMQFYISQLSSRRKSMTAVATKRHRLKTQSHVLTSEEYRSLSEEVVGNKPTVANSRISHELQVLSEQPSSGDTSDNDVPVLPSFLKPIPRSGDYVVIRYAPPKQKKAVPVFYVGVLLNKLADGLWRIQCMRHRSGSKFAFPPVDDISEFSVSGIMTFLSTPKIVKSIYHFSNDFSRFSASYDKLFVFLYISMADKL